MNAALRADPAAMRVNLTVPTTAVRVDPFAFDGLRVSRPNDFCLLASQSRSHFRRRNQRGKKHTLAETRAILWDKLWAKRAG